ncbi:MAG: hypothetical protein JST30_10005 [Armatimonadetes bacterium]|nr:hypothetical protein [Armatimonadota bacterium]
MLGVLAFPFYILSLVCSIIILIHAFKNAVWKGILGFFCGIYLLYYMFVEFQHEKKWLIIAGSLGGGIIGYIFAFMGAMQAAGSVR